MPGRGGILAGRVALGPCSWGHAARNESLLIGLLNPVCGVKPCLGLGWVGLVSALLPPHTLQHSEIPTEAFKSRTLPRKTFCNTSSVLQARVSSGGALPGGQQPPKWDAASPLQ